MGHNGIRFALNTCLVHVRDFSKRLNSRIIFGLPPPSINMVILLRVHFLLVGYNLGIMPCRFRTIRARGEVFFMFLLVKYNDQHFHQGAKQLGVEPPPYLQ